MMIIKKLKNFFCYDIFYFLLIFLLVAGASCRNIAIAQTVNQQLSYDSTEPFSLVSSLDPSGKVTVDYSFQQGNLLVIIYGKSNLKVFDLDSNQLVYEISYSDSQLLKPYLLENYLIYLKKSGQDYQTIRVDLSTEEPESILFPGLFIQVTDDGYLITSQGYQFQLIDLEDEQCLLEMKISKSMEILSIDDIVIFSFDDSKGNKAGYKAVSTHGELKFSLEERFNEIAIILPDYRSKISKFPFPLLKHRKNLLPGEFPWFLEFIDQEGNIVTSYPINELNLNYSNIKYIDSLYVLDENQNHFLLEFRYYQEGESLKFHYILTDLSGNIIKIFDETERCDCGFDLQGNILLLPRGGLSRDILKHYGQNGNMVFSETIPCLVISGVPREFKFPSLDAILGWEYNQFTKYSLTNGELTGIYPISTDYQIYTSDTIIFNNQVYFFAKPRGGCEPKITGSNYFSFSAADSGWIDIELVSIRPNAGTIYEVWDNTEVKVKFRTEYGSNFGTNLTVNFEKGELLNANYNNLEYIWHTPTIVSGSQDTAKITVSYGPISQEFIITIKDHLPTASFNFNPLSPQTRQNIRFDASLSFDLDGEITSYHWDFGDGIEEQEQQQNYIDHLFSTTGEYPVTLTVTDNNGQNATIRKNIRVTEVNYEFSSYVSNFSSSGGNGEFTVSPSYSDCQWTAETDASWIQINSGGTGPGSKILSFSIQNNSGEEERIGHITIENKIHTITQEPKLKLTLSNQGRTFTSNIPIFVNADEVGTEIDLDGDGILQEWEDIAMEYINPYIELDEEEPWLIRRNAPHIVLAEMDTKIVIPPLVAELGERELEKYGGLGLITTATDHVANFVRVHPYVPNVTDQAYYSTNLSEYIIFRYVITWSEDYGRFGFTEHHGDHERIFMAWKVINNKTLELKWIFTSSHKDPDAHHGVWNAWERTCNTVDVSTILKSYDFSQLMCGELQFNEDNRLIFYAAEGKHALYLSCDMCEDVLLVSTTLTGEDCCGGGRFRFDCYNVGEPPDFIDPKVYDLSLDEKKLGGELSDPEVADIFFSKILSRYMVKIKTSDRDLAGTDAKIQIKLFGENNMNSQWFTVYSKPKPPRRAQHVGTFERGNMDNIFISCSDLGEISKIQVKHDNSGPGPGWHISEIWVEDLETNTMWHSRPNAWLDKVLWDDNTNKTFNLE